MSAPRDKRDLVTSLSELGANIAPHATTAHDCKRRTAAVSHAMFLAVLFRCLTHRRKQLIPYRQMSYRGWHPYRPEVWAYLESFPDHTFIRRQSGNRISQYAAIRSVRLF